MHLCLPPYNSNLRYFEIKSLVRRGVGEIPMSYNLGVAVSIPSFSQSVGWDFFWDALKPEPLPIEPSGVPGHKNNKTVNPPSQYWL